MPAPAPMSDGAAAMIGKHQPRVHAHQAQQHQRRRVIADPEIREDPEGEVGDDRDDRQAIGKPAAVPPPGNR